MNTPTQLVILDDWRTMRADHTPIDAATMIRDSYARVIARTLVDGHTPTRAVVDRFRAAEQWVQAVTVRELGRTEVAS